MSPVQADIEAAIRRYCDPYLNNNLLDAGCLESLAIDDGQVNVGLVLGYPAKDLCEDVARQLTDLIAAVAGVHTVNVDVSWRVDPAPVQGELEAMAGVSNIIAVASGKGGVGKSTTAANLALALAADGARVGILDADIYGPSMGQMFGIADGTRPEVKNDRFFMPIEAHGIQVMSMAFLVTEDTPVVWRGPMVSGALIQLLTQTLWRDLDYLVIDLPPGTGDIQLTLAQKIPVSGSVVVTTPQDLALIDARKGVEMFLKVGVPVLGVVENMAVHICSNCGHSEHLFGEGGGRRIAAQFDIDLLGSLPLSMMIREQADGGAPTVVGEPQSQIAMIYRDMARRVAARLWLRHQQTPTVPSLSIVDD